MKIMVDLKLKVSRMRIHFHGAAQEGLYRKYILDRIKKMKGLF